MAAIWAVGEFGINWEGREYIFRPSLLSISRLGSPAEIVEQFVQIMQPARGPLRRYQSRQQFRVALHVLSACGPDDVDLTPLLGSYSERLRYRPGVLPLDDIVTLGQHLMRHGVAGVSPNGDEPLIKGEPLQRFEAGKFASMAMAHLGLNSQDAWSLTMTGLIAALTSKFPPDKTSAASITEKEYSDTMDWLKRVNAKRTAKK